MRKYTKSLVKYGMFICLAIALFNGDVARLASKLSDAWNHLMSFLPEPVPIIVTIVLYFVIMLAMLFLGYWLDERDKRKVSKI